jgi:hypothetical protein
MNNLAIMNRTGAEQVHVAPIRCWTRVSHLRENISVIARKLELESSVSELNHSISHSILCTKHHQQPQPQPQPQPAIPAQVHLVRTPFLRRLSQGSTLIQNCTQQRQKERKNKIISTTRKVCNLISTALLLKKWIYLFIFSNPFPFLQLTLFFL